jgi:hypothetical protein
MINLSPNGIDRQSASPQLDRQPSGSSLSVGEGTTASDDSDERALFEDANEDVQMYRNCFNNDY